MKALRRSQCRATLSPMVVKGHVVSTQFTILLDSPSMSGPLNIHRSAHRLHQRAMVVSNGVH
eukprot:scaffold1511_cov170-Amphora_coffeaeformis.AAC.16